MAIKLRKVEEDLEKLFIEEKYITDHSDFLKKYKSAEEEHYISEYDDESIGLEEFLIACTFDKGFYFPFDDIEEEYAEDQQKALKSIRSLIEGDIEEDSVWFVIPCPVGDYTSQVLVPKSVARVLYSVYTNPDYLSQILINNDYDYFVALVDILKGIGLTNMAELLEKNTQAGFSLKSVVQSESDIEYFINNYSLS